MFVCAQMYCLRNDNREAVLYVITLMAAHGQRGFSVPQLR